MKRKGFFQESGGFFHPARQYRRRAAQQAAASMNTSGNMALNITKATAYLKNQRKQFESQLSPEASVNYTSLLSEIRALERELSSPKYENQLQEYSKLRDSVRNELEHQKIEKED